MTRVIEPTQKAFDGGSLEDGVRAFMDGICGNPGCFEKFPQPRRTELVEKQAPSLRAEMTTETASAMPPLDCGDLGKLKLPTLLVTGERSPAMFLLITAELEHCLKGESQVMVPEAGHVMHGDNPTFYNQAVMAFLQRR